MKNQQKKKPKKKLYFTKVHEQAILDYVATDDINVRTELYKKFIAPSFNEMVDKIVYTYKFTSLPNIEILKDDCKIFLITILDKFNPDRGSKAFSYFSVISKNWFIQHTKKNIKRIKNHIEYGDVSCEDKIEFLSTRNGYNEKREIFEFLFFLEDEIDSWNDEPLKENEKKILHAIRMLFKDVDNIEIFNKKAVYLYIREITSLSTKQVVSCLFKFRKKYKKFKKEWDNGEI